MRCNSAVFLQMGHNLSVFPEGLENLGFAGFSEEGAGKQSLIWVYILYLTDHWDTEGTFIAPQWYATFYLDLSLNLDLINSLILQ